MKFQARGMFETETLIDVTQRLVAQLQDAGVERVAGVNIYLSVLDRKGAPCPLLLDGEAIDVMRLDCADLALEHAEPNLAIGKAGRDGARRSAAPKPRRRT